MTERNRKRDKYNWGGVVWNKTDAVIAREQGCSQEAVRRHRQKHGIPGSPDRYSHTKTTALVKFLRQNTHLTRLEAAQHLAISIFAVYTYCSKYHIQLRDRRSAERYDLMNWDLPNKYLANIWGVSVYQIGNVRKGREIGPARFDLRKTGYEKSELESLVELEKEKSRKFYRSRPETKPAESQHIQGQLVTSENSYPNEAGDETDRYNEFQTLLRAIVTTDRPKETKVRLEQSILQDWLFEGREKECCAICGREFHTSALVAAHKKRRADCTEDERRDPYIVMPLCVFGCDWLYERGFVTISEGKVLATPNAPRLGHAGEVVRALNSRQVDAQWLRGSDAYFKKFCEE